MKLKHSVLAILSGAALAGTALAQTPPSNTDPSNRDPSTTAPRTTTSPGANTTTNSTTLRTANAPQPTDAELMKKLAVGGMAEVEGGRLATQRAADREVKEFGEHMIADHSKANEKLKALAQKENVELPTRLDAEHASQKAMLEKHNGAKFDQEYMSAMVKAHEKTVALLENQVSSGRDQDVKQYAQETLPTVKRHLDKARELHAKVGNAPSAATGPRTDAGPRADALTRPDANPRTDADKTNSAARDRDDATTTR